MKLRAPFSIPFSMKVTPVKFWSAIFGIWGLFLSGLLASFVDSPGVIQIVRLNSLLAMKQAQINALHDQVVKLQGEANLIQSSRVVQEREIRRVLGYAAPDELIFDFKSGESL